MSKIKVKFDYNQIIKFRKELEQVTQKEIDVLCKEIVYRLANELLEKVKMRTPVNQGLPNDVNFHGGGGRLRDSWTIGNVTKSGNIYMAEVINPMHYASYVEKGHDGVYIPELGVSLYTRKNPGISKEGKKIIKWTEGVFMLKISEDELQKDANKFVEMKLDKFIRERLRR